ELRYTAGDAGRGTDLESAIREAIASVPAGMVPRVVLVSDGKENHGSIARAAWQARQLGVPIDTFALAGKPQPSLRLESISLPFHSFTGERFPIDLVVSSPRPAQGVIELAADGKSIGKNPVSIDTGTNRLRVHANLSAAGAFDVAVAVSAPGLGELRFDQAITLRRPRVLFFSQDPRAADEHLLQALDAAHFEVQRSADVLAPKLSDFQLVVLNNWDLESLPTDRKNELENFVKQGGGLLVIGGDRNVYVETKNADDGLDRALPAELAPPRSPEGTCVVLIIDKSSSMEGRKMELARLASIGVIENLRPIDQIGILIFDNSFQWAVPIRRAEDRSLIKRLVAGITPDGGTQIAPALNEAYRRILASKATYKHIVLLTDGISEEGDSLELSKESTHQHVTISTVGLGQDVNRAYLEKIASYSGGKSYFLSEPSGLEQILLRDVMEHSGSTAIEKVLQPVVAHPAEILDGVGMESAPPLKGYVKFMAKPTAETILTIDKEKKDPLLTRWQYGLGRAAVFASDAKNRWAADWVGWKGYDRFWTNLFRDLLPHA
ncbi:MAG: VWA domain-containing protein, partial [Bryobacteraceae bacterium]